MQTANVTCHGCGLVSPTDSLPRTRLYVLTIPTRFVNWTPHVGSLVMSSHSSAPVGTRVWLLSVAATLDDMVCARPLSPGPKRRVGDVTAGYTPRAHPNLSASLHLQQTASNSALDPSIGANYAHHQPKTPMTSNGDMQAEFRCHPSSAMRRPGRPVYRPLSITMSLRPAQQTARCNWFNNSCLDLVPTRLLCTIATSLEGTVSIGKGGNMARSVHRPCPPVRDQRRAHRQVAGDR